MNVWATQLVFLAELVSLAKIPFIAVEGNGLAGSIFALTKASSMIISGNLAEAKTLLQTVDQEFVGTKIVKLFAELSQGRAASVVEKAHLLRKETKGLQQLEMMRLSLLAQALLMTDAKTEAIELLSMSNSSAVALSRVELSYFSPTVNDFAAKNITGWPDTDQRIEAQFIADLMQKKPVFSQREIEVLGLLADGKTREEIAQTLFISINTVKKHLQKIYQSLGVASRNAAVLEAQKRGLI